MRTLRIVPTLEGEVEIKRRMTMIDALETCISVFVLLVVSAVAIGLWAAIVFWTFLFATGQA